MILDYYSQLCYDKSYYLKEAISSLEQAVLFSNCSPPRKGSFCLWRPALKMLPEMVSDPAQDKQGLWP